MSEKQSDKQRQSEALIDRLEGLVRDHRQRVREECPGTAAEEWWSTEWQYLLDRLEELAGAGAEDDTD
jgi:hypothetical protein